MREARKEIGMMLFLYVFHWEDRLSNLVFISINKLPFEEDQEKAQYSHIVQQSD